MVAALFLNLFFVLTDPNVVGKIEKNYSALIEAAVQKYPYFNSEGSKRHINPALVMAVIYQESGGNPEAKSAAGAYGLMQIMPKTATLLGCDYGSLGSPEHSINCGVKFLAALLSYNRGDLVKSLSGYNGGTYSTEASPTTDSGLLAGRIYDNPETKKYVVSVLKLYELFEKRGSSRKKRAKSRV